MAESQQFGNIVLGGKDAHRDESTGTLKMHADGFGFKSRKTGNIISIQKADLRSTEWIKIPHAYQLKVKARGGFAYRFNGFRGQDKETVRGFVSETFGLELETRELSYKGWNWGQASIDGGNVSFNVEDKQTLEVPLTDISQASAQKNEAVIEFGGDDTALPEDEVVVEMRFHLPAATGEDVTEMDGTPAEDFVDKIKQSGDLEVAGASLVTLDDVPVQVPRGRYDLELCDKFLKMHGKSNDYKVLYTNIASLYLLPKPDNYHMALVVNLEHALRQGSTSYPHIVFQLPRDTPLEVEVALSESDCSARFGEKLDKFESGDYPSLMAKVISAFAKKKVSSIKSGGFNADQTDDRHKSIRCSLKAVDGFLYPLDKAFFFLANKPVLVELDRVASVEFNRVDKSSAASAARTFDITVHMKDQSSDHQFVNLQRSDYKELYRFLTSKSVRIKNIASAGYADADDADDDADDPYMQRVRSERAAAAAAEAGDDDDDDDDDEEDEDFVGGSGSEVDEEFESDADSDDEGAKAKGKAKAKASKAPPPKKRKKEAGSDDGSGSGSDDEEEAASSGASSSDDEARKPKKKKAKVEESIGILAGSKGKGKAAKKKAKKDPNAPKKAMSAYMLWMNQEGRDQAKAEGVSGIGPIGKLCGERWRSMDAGEKAPWEAKAKADKARYESAMAEYSGKGKGKAAVAADDDSDEPDAASSSDEE